MLLLLLFNLPTSSLYLPQFSLKMKKVSLFNWLKTTYLHVRLYSESPFLAITTKKQYIVWCGNIYLTYYKHVLSPLYYCFQEYKCLTKMKLINCPEQKDCPTGSDSWISFFLFNIWIENNYSGLHQNMSVFSIHFKTLKQALFNISYMWLFELK